MFGLSLIRVFFRGLRTARLGAGNAALDFARLEREHVTKLGGLGFGIFLIFEAREDRVRNALDDPDLVSFEAGDLAGVVGQEADGGNTLVVEDRGGVVVGSPVGREAEVEVGLDSIHPLVLQSVGLDFVLEPDAAALLSHIDQDALALAAEKAQRRVKLLTTIAADRTECVASQSL